MNQLWQNPQLRVLLILNIVALGVLFIFVVTALYIFLKYNWKNRDSKDKESQKFKKFIDRLKINGVPSEISSAFDELHEEMVIIEESNVEQTKTFFVLVEGLEEKMKLMQNSTNTTENKMIAVLHSIVAKLKIANRQRVDKHADNLFKRLNRLEKEDLTELDKRLVDVETFIEALQILNGTPEKAVAESKVGNG